jgi:secondary thiamine-phosphate synthase enzyme
MSSCGCPKPISHGSTATVERETYQIPPAPVTAVHRMETISGEFIATQSILSVVSQSAPDWIDITDSLLDFVSKAGAGVTGQLTVLSRHTTASIAIQENEPLLQIDLARKLLELAHPDEYYQHDDFSIRTENLMETNDANGHSHCQALLVGQTVTLPVHQGEIQLGRWQRVFLLELDSPRPRQALLRLDGIKQQ